MPLRSGDKREADSGNEIAQLDPAIALASALNFLPWHQRTRLAVDAIHARFPVRWHQGIAASFLEVLPGNIADGIGNPSGSAWLIVAQKDFGLEQREHVFGHLPVQRFQLAGSLKKEP